jgi:zinc protease
MKLALLAKKTRGATVTAVVRVHFGDEKSVFGKQTAAAIAGVMLMRGTAKHTRQQLSDEIDKAKARITASGGDTFAQASISTVRDNFLTSLRLAAEVLREPTFPEAEFETVKNQSLAAAEGSRTDPGAIAFSAINRHLAPFPPGDPRNVPTVDERIAYLKAVKLDDVKAFYRDFYGASNSELAVVGDFDPAAVEKLARELFGDWKSPKPYAEILRGYRKLETINQSFETPDKTNAFFVAANTVPMDQASPDYAAMLLANSMMGGGLKSRLWLRIREKEGLSYTVQSDFNAGVKDHIGQFIALVACNPQNIVKVEASFFDEMKKAASAGFPEDEVKTAKDALLKEMELSRSQDGALLGQLARNALYGWTMQRQADLESKIGALSPAEVSAAFKRTIDPAALSIVKAGDFKKAGITQ